MKDQKHTETSILVDGEPADVHIEDLPGKVSIDTSALDDGEHSMTIITTNADGLRDEKHINFNVRNGSFIMLDGVKDGDEVRGELNFLVNAFSYTKNSSWNPNQADAPMNIPGWFWPIFFTFIIGSLGYVIIYWQPNTIGFNDLEVSEINWDWIVRLWEN